MQMQQSVTFVKILIWKFVSRDVEWRRTWYLEWRDKLDLNDR